MLRRLGMTAVLFLVPLTASAGVPDASATSQPPEALLAKASLGYFRFDGLESHRRAYEQTVLAEVMNGDVQDFFHHVGGLLQNSVGHGAVREKMLAGSPPDQLLRIHRAASLLPRLPEYLRRHGVLLGVEVVALLPQQRAQLTLVFPHGGAAPDREALFAGFQLVCALNDLAVKSLTQGGRGIFQVELGSSLHMAWWQEGEHVVCTIGTEQPEYTLELIQGKRRNLTENHLFRAVQDFDRYETVARGFVDLEGALRLVQAVGLARPQVKQITQCLGVEGLKSLTMHVGFAGRVLRSTLSLRLTGKRKGLLRLASGSAGWAPEQLPPIAADASNVIAVHLDAATVYDVTREITEAITAALQPAQLAEVQNGFKKVDESLGINLRKDLLGALGSRVVLYNSPGEGPFGLGIGLAVEVKDADKLRAALDTVFRSLPGILDTTVDLRKRNYRGVEVCTVQFGERGGFPLAPTWAIHKSWLTLGLYPQTAHGFILRAGGQHAVWKPTPLVNEVLAEVRKNPRARILALTQSDPRRPLTDLASFSPFFASAINSSQQSDFDIGLIPHFQALTDPLFPNVGVVVDEGDAIRLETYASVGLPFDALGVETYWFSLLLLGNIF